MKTQVLGRGRKGAKCEVSDSECALRIVSMSAININPKASSNRCVKSDIVYAISVRLVRLVRPTFVTTVQNL